MLLFMLFVILYTFEMYFLYNEYVPSIAGLSILSN